MPDQVNWDLVIVGGSVAGLSVGFSLPPDFGKTLIIESKKKIGTPVHCAEYVPIQARAEIPELEDFAAQRIRAMDTIYPTGRAETSPYQGYILDRDRLEERLADRVRDRGVKIVTGVMAWELAPDGVRLGDDRLIRARLVVGADGPGSRIGLGIGAPVERTVMAVQYTVEMPKPLANTRVFFSRDIPGGYGWVFPKGELAHVGLGLTTELTPRLGLWEILDRFLAERVEEGVVTDVVVSKTGGKLPSSGIVKRLWAPAGADSPPCFLVGDAAGLCDPITGAGILSAWQSGKILARMLPDIAAGKLDPAAYDARVRKVFGRSIGARTEFRKYLDQRWSSLSRSQLEKALRKVWMAPPPKKNEPGE